MTDAIVSAISPGKKPGNQLGSGNHSILRVRFEQALKIEHRHFGTKIEGPRSPMFEFVRAIKNCDGLWDLDEQEAGELINELMKARHSDSPDAWKSEFPEHEYPLEAFLDNWTQVTFPSGKLERAAILAKSRHIQPPGLASTQYCEFLSLAGALQELSGDASIFLSVRKVGGVLGVSKSAVATYIRLSVKAGFLQRLKEAIFNPENQKACRAAEYRFVNITKPLTNAEFAESGHKELKGSQGTQGVQGKQGTQELAILTNRNHDELLVQSSREETGKEKKEPLKEVLENPPEAQLESVSSEKKALTTQWQDSIHATALPGAVSQWKAYLASNGVKREPTGKEFGILKKFSKDLAENAANIMKFVLSHWHEFAGCNGPDDPNVGWLITHEIDAVKAYDKHLKGIADKQAWEAKQATIKAANAPPTLEEQLIRDAKAYSHSCFSSEEEALLRAILTRWPDDVATNADILRKYWCAPMNKSADERYAKLVAALKTSETAQPQGTPLQEHPEPTVTHGA